MTEQKQITRGILWEEAMGKLRAIDHTFYSEKEFFEEWVSFRRELEDRRNNQGLGGF